MSYLVRISEDRLFRAEAQMCLTLLMYSLVSVHHVALTSDKDFQLKFHGLQVKFADMDT